MFASRAGEKLEFALNHFNLDVTGLICADLGCSTGGFTDCLLQKGAAKVYSVDTGYGVLDYKLRTNPKVIVLERTNALHVALPEPVDFMSIDVGWTPQALILPHALTLLSRKGQIISLLKPHYEAHKSYLSEEEADSLVQKVIFELTESDIKVQAYVASPILGEKGKNKEFLLHILH